MTMMARAHVRRLRLSTHLPVLLIAVLAAVLLATVFAEAISPRVKSHAQPGEHSGTRIEGVLTQVHAAYVVVRTDDGKEFTLQTQEDFRPKVGPGSKVKAWYLPGGDGYFTLEWLEYPWESFFTPWDVIHSEVKTVAILPTSEVPDASGFFAVLAAYLRTNLHWSVPEVSPPAASSTLEAVDPATGQFDAARYTGQGPQTVATLMASAQAQAVLEVDIRSVQAPVRDRVAVWDGIQESLGGGPKAGEAPATTVALKLWGTGGKLLWINQRGFAVLETSSGGHLRDRSLAEVLRNTAGVRDWLNMMFAGLVSRPQ